LGPYVFKQGYFLVSVEFSDDFVGTVTLQRSFNNGKKPWIDVDNFIVPTETYAVNGGNDIYYRLGIKPGKLDSGSVTVRMGV